MRTSNTSGRTDEQTQGDPMSQEGSAVNPPGSGGDHRARCAIGLDVGGTKIAGGVVTDEGQILDRALLPTPLGDEAATLAALRRVIDSLRERHPMVEAIGVGAAGIVEWPSGYIRWAPNNAYRELPLHQLLHEHTGLPSVVDNDANVAALAEARFGAGASHDNTALIVVGTGVGAGLVLDGRLYRGAIGLAGEFGHVTVNLDEVHLCGCGKVGCLEALASGTALGRMGRNAAEEEPGGRLAALAGGPANVTGETVFRAASEGDPTARALFAEAGFWLGLGISVLVNILDLRLVIIGGGLVAAGNLLLDPARSSFERYLFARTRRTLPPIVPARLGADAGLVGAALIALDERPEAAPRRADAELRGVSADE
jgi:glucokinase